MPSTLDHLRLTRSVLLFVLTFTSPALAQTSPFYDHAIALVFHPETTGAEVQDFDDLIRYRLDDGEWGLSSSIMFRQHNPALWQLRMGINSLTRADFGTLRQVYTKPWTPDDTSERFGVTCWTGRSRGSTSRRKSSGWGEVSLTITTANSSLDEGAHREPDDSRFPLYDYPRIAKDIRRAAQKRQRGRAAQLAAGHPDGHSGRMKGRQ